MRTQEEIVARINEREKIDFFGFERDDYLKRLDYEHAKPFLADGVTHNQWIEATATTAKDDAGIRQVAIEYMDFAWEKANNERGLSAARTMSHYTAWFWLLGHELGDGRLLSYVHYGKEHLRLICKELGLDPDKWDDGVRTN
jgi:hypothetical protein